jgi:3-hydroxybutyryl-CoA dehydratase
MKTPIMPRRTFSQLAVEERVEYSRTLTEADVALFIGVTWDVNPYHTDEAFCQQTPFKHRIVPGLLTASLLTHLGGLAGFLATEMHFYYQAPVYAGDTITAQGEIVELDETSGLVKLGCCCINQDGKEVLRAEVSGFPTRQASS